MSKRHRQVSDVERRLRAIRSLGLSPQVEEALIEVSEEIREIGQEEGAAVAFGLMSMAEAIRWNYLCPHGCGRHVGPLLDDSTFAAFRCTCWAYDD